MDSIYIISLIVGGFFVLLSLFGGADSDADFDVEADFDADFDSDLDLDGPDSDIGAGTGLVDLFSIRALFLFGAFFGLTGLLLGIAGTGEPLRAILSTVTGGLVGLGGNYVIRKVGYKVVSSDITIADLKGQTGKVLLPFDGDEKGKITVVARGQRHQLVARSVVETKSERFNKGDEIVIVNIDGRVVEVVKPN